MSGWPGLGLVSRSAGAATGAAPLIAPGTPGGAHGEITVGLEGNDVILDSRFIKAMGRVVIDNDVSACVYFVGYPGGGERGAGNDVVCLPCMR